MCFDLSWFEHLLIWVVIIGAIVAIVKVLLPMVFAQLGAPSGAIVQIINIFLWAVIAIFVIIIAFELIGCLLGSGSLNLGPMRR